MGILIVLVLVILLTTTLKFLPSSFYPIPFSYPWRSGSEAKEKGYKRAILLFKLCLQFVKKMLCHGSLN